MANSIGKTIANNLQFHLEIGGVYKPFPGMGW